MALEGLPLSLAKKTITNDTKNVLVKKLLNIQKAVNGLRERIDRIMITRPINICLARGNLFNQFSQSSAQIR
jgi:hypothetical protein